MNIDTTDLKALILGGKFIVMLIYFKCNNDIADLINRMTEGQPENVRLQISLQNTQSNRIIETKLMSKHKVIEKRWNG